MILMNDLKPILEPLLNDENSAEIIEAINGIDKDYESEEVDRINKEWNAKFRDAFLTGAGVPQQSIVEQVTETTTETKEEVDDAPHTFSELFKEV